MNPKRLQEQVQTCLLNGAELLLQELNKTNTPFGGEHLHSFCLERAANIAAGLSYRVIDAEDEEAIVAYENLLKSRKSSL